MEQNDPIRAQKADRWDALVASGVSPDEATKRVEAEFAAKPRPAAQVTPAESTAVAPRQAQPQEPKTSTTLGEDVVGLTRAAMNKLTFGQYPRMVGALASLGGADAQAEAQRLAEYMAEYKRLNPSKTGVAETVGEVAPYFAAGPAMVASRLGAIPAVARGAQAASRGYAAARTLPLASKVLPMSAKTAGQIMAIEGLRGASEAKEGESVIGQALKSATFGLPFGRFGEVAGTYLAGKFGQTLSKQAAQAEEAAQKAGEAMNRWKEIESLEVTPALSKLYARSKDLRDAVTAAAESMGLPATNPMVLAEAYSTLTKAGSPNFKKTILKPFLQAIDEAAAPLVKAQEGLPSFGKSVGEYAKAMDVKGAIAAAEATGRYMQTGAGKATEVGPDVLAGRLGRQFVSDAERQAAAQALIASIRERSSQVPSTIRGGLMEAGRTILTGGPRGVGDIADLANRLGGGSPGQQFAQRLGLAFGASR